MGESSQGYQRTRGLSKYPNYMILLILLQRKFL
jgi:hypothetical protein